MSEQHGSTGSAALPAWWSPRKPHDACAGREERAVLTLYAEALAVVRLVRRDPSKRAGEIGQALRILSQLAGSLLEREDREGVTHLTALYHYMIHRLNEASEAGAQAPLDEVERLLQTLWEGWVQVMQSDVDDGFPQGLGEDDRSAGPPPPVSPLA